MKIVMDTNILLAVIPRKSPYRRIFEGLINGDYELFISNEILTEYLEIIGRKTNQTVANNIGEFLVNSRFVSKIEVFYRWGLIVKDPDDNKFADCAIAGNVEYLVSNDAHFNVLKSVNFPTIEVIRIDDFLKELEKRRGKS